LLYQWLTNRELVELRGAFILEPRSGTRLDLAAARLEAAIYNTDAKRKKGRELIDPNELLPDYSDPSRWEFEPESLDEIEGDGMSPEQMVAILKAAFPQSSKK